MLSSQGWELQNHVESVFNYTKTMNCFHNGNLSDSAPTHLSLSVTWPAEVEDERQTLQ